MSFGEMTITLDDVRVLLGIQVTRKTVVVKSNERVEVTAMVSHLLGILVGEVDEEIRSRSGPTVRLPWLKERFAVPTKRLLDEVDEENEEEEEEEEEVREEEMALRVSPRRMLGQSLHFILT
ncbi:hypothetical protein Syun_001379 [Stephania yunnanensis]|uniref:Uncharacterized protein n=1 Tax=Stephania yunnanensis TaxID=152371 RepID=A0AAP0Q7P8_9MAGN